MENNNGKTPQELFTEEHTAFSIPGGTDDKTGRPNFLREKAFLYFTIADGVALFSSSTAMLMFLFILTSRYAENDFLKSLPLKLMTLHLYLQLSPLLCMRFCNFLLYLDMSSSTFCSSLLFQPWKRMIY
ncbi:hypothetical protein M0R45_001758 [Rubus argutus]|uniref:PGG domain-containing protein n=1 Tax=Rubus argutus TaxID=59490 RepID=A0AAW1VKY2_RUBAR